VKKRAPRPVTDGKYKGFSVCEKDLYKEVHSIHERERYEALKMKERMKAFFSKKMYERYMPVPTKKHENKMAFGKNSEAALIEWEKNQIKPFFRAFDKDKKGCTKAELVKIMERL